MNRLALVALCALLIVPGPLVAQETPTMTGNGSAEAPMRPTVGLYDFKEHPEKFENVSITLKYAVVSTGALRAGEFYALSVSEPSTGTYVGRVPSEGELVFVISEAQYRSMRAKLPGSDSYPATVWFTIEPGKANGEARIWLGRVSGIEFFSRDGRTLAIVGGE